MKGIKKIFLIPNLITAINLFFGFLSIIMSVEGDYLIAAWLIILAIIFDGLDGKIARSLNAYSYFGQEFDSFCDSVSFGIAPAILIYLTLIEANYLRSFIILLSFLFILSGILRLARFNTTIELSGEKEDFVGMPIPTGAGLIVSYYIFTDVIWGSFVGLHIFLLIIIFAIFSMVSNISYQNPTKIISKFKFEIMIIALIILPFIKYSIFPIFLLYILVNNLKVLKYNLQRNSEAFSIK